MRTVRWGIIGPGGVARRFAKDITQVDGAEVVAVASREVARAGSFAAEHAVRSAYGSALELIDDPDVDIVYVATPHIRHHEHAMLALDRGKAVLVEKPLTMSLREAEALVAVARERQTFLMEGLWTLCNPLVRDLVARVQRGDIGEPLAFSANAGPIGTRMSRGSGSRLEDPAQGASFLFECHVYSIALLLEFMPAFSHLSSLHAASVFTDRNVDESTSMIAKAGSGAVATLAGGFAPDSTEGPPWRLVLTGSRGWLEIRDDFVNPREAFIGTAEGIETVRSDAHARGFAWQIEEAGRAFLAGGIESPLVPHRRSLDIARLLQRARDSAGISVGAAR